MLEFLGWMVNYEKYELISQKTLAYLGIDWNTWLNQKSLPEEKVLTMSAKVKRLLEESVTTLSELQSLVGLLKFASFAVPKGRLNYRALLTLLNTLHKNKYHPILCQSSTRRFLLQGYAPIVCQ